MLKRGPEIKLSSLKVPGFLRDLYEDLRERHLLPLVAVLLVAIVAIPIAFGGGSSYEREGAGASVESGASTGAAEAEEAAQVVAKATPGLRRYQRRLEDLRAKDPFEQQYSNTSGGSGEGSSGSGGEGSGTTTTEVTTGGDGGTTTGSGEGTSRTTYERTYYSYAIDVRVTALGKAGASSSEATGSAVSDSETPSSAASSGATTSKAKPTVRRNLPELTMLPSRNTPALVFVGATKDEKKALFVISSDVEALFGDGKCVLGSQRCEMLVLEPGLPETVVYGRAGRTFRIELLKVGLVESKKINRAPLGKSKQGKQKE